MPAYRVEPWAHQKVAIERARDMDYFALFFEQGTGKTSALINILREKISDESKPFRTLILCPPIVIENWKSEFARYSYIPQDRIVPLVGSEKKRIDAFFDTQHFGRGRQLSGNRIFITNYQALLMPQLYLHFLECGFTCVVLDESHKIKSHNSKTTKAVLKLGKTAKYRFILSGTPILNDALDLYPQISFLDHGKTFGPKFTMFRQEHYADFNAGMPRYNYFPNWKIRPGALEKIQKAIEPISLRVLKKDCLDLPPLIRQTIQCPMTVKQKRIYTTLEKEFVAELEKGQVITDLELTKCLRLQQIVSGYVPNELGEIHEFEGNTRIEAVSELLESIPATDKILIWASFRENFRQLESLLLKREIPFVSVYGGMGAEMQRANCRAFEERAHIRVLVGHPRSCGIGVNLTAAAYSIFYSRGFSLEDDLQAEARNYRGGSERHSSIVRIDLTTPDTIDEVILEALARKQGVSDAVLKHYGGKHGK